jgi:hypothetical protein
MTHPVVEKCARAQAARYAAARFGYVADHPQVRSYAEAKWKAYLGSTRAVLEALIEPDETYVFDREFTAAIRSLLEEK